MVSLAAETSDAEEFVESTGTVECEEEVVVVGDSRDPVIWVIQRVLLSPTQLVYTQRHSLFKTRCTIKKQGVRYYYR